MTAQATAVRAGKMTGAIRITDPFHPQFGQEIDVVVRRPNWGEDRIFYHDRQGHLASLPARWTSVVAEDPLVPQ